MRDKRQNHQLELAFMVTGRGEASDDHQQGTESRVAGHVPESTAADERLMEEVCERENLKQALRRVKSNKGAPGVDGMTVDEIGAHLAEHWPTIRFQLLAGHYRPLPVKRVDIPKRGGGMRQLGVPTVLDRFIQQAVLQVLQKRWDSTFSEHSYGFRPRRSAHQAVAKAQAFLAEGRGWVVDVDLEKFFDRVHHDRLMARVAERVTDKRMLGLIRAFLTAGVMENGLVSAKGEGTPQGGPLSPLLSNIVLDELDRELERRGHRFVRYADDCNIYVRSERAGQRVMQSITGWLERRLRLQVNRSKSAVARPQERQFLGFSFTKDERPRRRIGARAVTHFKQRVRQLTARNRGLRLEELIVYLRGWRSYFAFTEAQGSPQRLDAWLRRRLRAAIWKQWKRGRTRYAELTKRRVDHTLAAKLAGSAHGAWRLSRTPTMSLALPNAYFDSLGIPRLAAR
jgi:RNA-directed DNA polymerase